MAEWSRWWLCQPQTHVAISWRAWALLAQQRRSMSSCQRAGEERLGRSVVQGVAGSPCGLGDAEPLAGFGESSGGVLSGFNRSLQHGVVGGSVGAGRGLRLGSSIRVSFGAGSSRRGRQPRSLRQTIATGPCPSGSIGAEVPPQQVCGGRIAGVLAGQAPLVGFGACAQALAGHRGLHRLVRRRYAVSAELGCDPGRPASPLRAAEHPVHLGVEDPPARLGRSRGPVEVLAKRRLRGFQRPAGH